MGSTDRAVSESAGVGALIVLTVLATASVGLTALLANEEDPTQGTGFSVRFEYSSNLQQLQVFPNGEEPVQAGDVIISGPNGNSTWAEVADVGEEDTVSPGDRPLFVGENTGYGSKVKESDTISVIYEPPDGKSATFTWNEGAGEDEGGDGPVDSTPGGGI